MAAPDSEDRQHPGLTAAEVAEREARGEVNAVEIRTSRSVAGILRENVLTRFNAIITALLVLVLVFGDPKDGLFGMVMIFNVVIGVVQELRAKRTLDRLTVLATPRVGVRRDGRDTEVASGDIVRDDVVILEAGDQVPVDGAVLRSAGMQVDESLLTGEADPVDKSSGDQVMSGSFVVSGGGLVRADRIGGESYAHRLSEEARQFTLTKSELKVGIDRILRIVTWIIVPTGLLLFWSQVFRGDFGLSEGIVSAVAGTEGMVPQGLVLLTSMALAVAVIRLGRRNALVQELPAVETLARVDVLCLDKTGTLTEGRMVHDRTEIPGAREDAGLPSGIRDALAALASVETNPNPTLAAIGEAYPAGDGDADGWETTVLVPFSSSRKWSGASFVREGTWVLGAPEVLLPACVVGPEAEVETFQTSVRAHAAAGKRVLLLAGSPCEGLREQADPVLPAGLEPRALVLIEEKVRPDAQATVAYFEEQGVGLKVISGDSPVTVSAIAREVGIPGADRSVDARDLPEDEAGLDRSFGDAVEHATVLGRVTPGQKQAMVLALQDKGHTVAMTGDGVNDVLALKNADMGIAMGSGAAATRAVSQLVLIDGKFSVLPGVVAEGRRVIANMERVATLFLTKTVYSALLAWVVSIAFAYPYPFRPIHLTFVGSVTIGIPAFFLSFEPTMQRARPGFLRRVLRRALPAGIVTGSAVFVVYVSSRAGFVDASLAQARTAATIELCLVALYVLFMVARPLNAFRGVVLALMAATVTVVPAIPVLAKFFDLPNPPTDVWAVILPTLGAAVVLLEAGWWWAGRDSAREVALPRGRQSS